MKSDDPVKDRDEAQRIIDRLTKDIQAAATDENVARARRMQLQNQRDVQIKIRDNAQSYIDYTREDP